MTTVRPLVIVGGGPAGMVAAIEAARAGLSCTLIDEAPHLGGQIYRPPPGEFCITEAQALGKDFLRGEQLRAELDGVADRVEVLSCTSVLGIWGGHQVLWATDQASGLIHADRLIIASGAYERPVPFPGWTLPGVMTAGGVQTLIKTMRIRPGRRALVAGTGALILSVAHRLQEIGVEVAVVLAAGTPAWTDEALVSEWDVVKEAREHWQALRRAGIPFLVNHTIFAAHGRNGVERASYGPIDPYDWRPCKDRVQSVDVDLVCIGFGFVPNTELTVLVGCHHEYIQGLGGWVPVRDALMQTTVPSIFAVGDGAGIRGAPAAAEQGGLPASRLPSRPALYRRRKPPDDARRHCIGSGRSCNVAKRWTRPHGSGPDYSNLLRLRRSCAVARRSLLPRFRRLSSKGHATCRRSNCSGALAWEPTKGGIARLRRACTSAEPPDGRRSKSAESTHGRR